MNYTDALKLKPKDRVRVLSNSGKSTLMVATVLHIKQEGSPTAWCNDPSIPIEMSDGIVWPSTRLELVE